MAQARMQSVYQPQQSASLRKLLVVSKDQKKKIESSHFTLPPVTSIVAEARRTVKVTPDVPSQTSDDKERVRYLRGLRNMVEELENEVESDITNAKNEAENNVKEYTLFGTSAINYEDAKAELIDLQEKGVKTYLKLVANDRVENSKRLREHKLRHDLQLRHMEENFSWYPHYKKLISKLHQKPHNERWRGQLHHLVTDFEQYARSPLTTNGLGFPNSPVKNKGSLVVGSDIPLFLRNYLRDLNSYDKKEAEKQLNDGLLDKLLDVEASKDEQFKIIREKGKNAKKNLDMIKINRKKKTAALMKTHAHHEGEEGGGGGDDHAHNGNETPAGMAHQLIDKRKTHLIKKLNNAKEHLPVADVIEIKRNEEIDDAIKRMLFETSLLPTIRGQEGKLISEYHQILVYCAQNGHWEGALKVYETLGQRHIPATFPTTFTTMLLACKNAKPFPNHELVYPILEEAEACGFALTREFYHSAMDVFRAAGHWRRAISVFNRMGASGINPTTHTYSLLEQSGAAAKNSDPSEVYAALTYAGVPAYLSYTAATACAQKRRPTDVGPIADWLGKDV